MATDGASCEPDFSRAPEEAAGAPAEAAKKEFDVDTLSKPELRMLLSVMEGELEARDLVIEALRARRKEVFIQERYGRFNLNDPFLALQRDYEAGAGDKEKKPVCTNPLSILEAVMAHCRKMQERMSTQLAAAESRQKKLEMEKLQLQALEQEHKKLAARLEEERGKNKHVVLMLVKECKQLSGRVIEEAQKLEEVMAKLEEEKKKMSVLEEELSAEKQRSTEMEAQMEKQLSEFDTEREQLRAKLHREEAHTTDLKEEIDKMKKMIEQLKRGNDSKPSLSLPRKTKDRRLVSISVGTEGPMTRSVACQTDLVTENTDPLKKLPLTVPVKPAAGSPLVSANAKGNVSAGAALVRPGIDRQASHGDLIGSSLPVAPPPSTTRIEENGPSTGSTSDLASNPSPLPSNAAPPTVHTPGPAPQGCSPAQPPHSLHSPCAGAPLHPGLNPRIQAARFRFQGWSPSLTPLLMSGGPAPLAGRPTLLQQAAAQGNVTLLSMLLNEEGLDINYSCEDGHSALYSAAKNGHTDCVRLLLNAEAQVNAADKNGFTPLCAAAAQGHFKCVELLIAYDANINHAADGGQTPLYLACKNGNKECIKLLLEAKTDRSVKTRDGWTPVHAAVDTGNVDSLKLLMYHRTPACRNSLHEEPESGVFDLNQGEENPEGSSKPVVPADLINHADSEGWTAAHIAASKGFKNCLEVLCGHGGLEPERRDKYNRTVHDVATDDCKHLLENLNALKIPLRISVGEIQPSNYGSDDFECENTICALNIRKQTTWDDFSKAVSQALTNHFQAISSDGWWSLEDVTFHSTTDSSIGLGASSVQSITLGNVPWSAGQSFTQSPWDFLRTNKAEQITVLLSGPQEGCLSSVTYASMIPLQMLQNYLRLVEQYHNVIFHGPEGSLQDYIAHQLALCMKHRQMAAGFSCEIVRAKVDAGFSKEQLVDLFISSACLIPVKQSPANKKIIIILENLEKSSLSELLGDFLGPLENRSTENPCTFQKGNGTSECYYFHENCFLLGTIAKACLQGSDLLVQQHFRWVQLRWDGEPMQGLLQRCLRRKVVTKFRGQVPSPCDPVCKTVDWALAVWRQLNSCLAHLGTPEALLGPKYFLSCPVIPGHAQETVRWMSKLWNAVIAPRVQAAILSRASLKRQPGLGQTTRNPSQGQQAVVRAALSILLNKAVLHGCPLQRAELDQHTADFKGGSFPLSIVSSYSSCSKKKDSGAWRKVSTSPRKKSGRFPSPTWNKPDLIEEGIKNKTILQLNRNRNASLSKQMSLESELSLTLNLEQRLSLGSDDEADLVKELQSMCSSKSESDISKIADSRDDLRRFDSSGNNPAFSATVNNPGMPVSQEEVSPLSSHPMSECSNSKSKTELGVSRVKSFLPVPRSKVTQCSQNTKRSSSSSNTRQIEINNNSKEEIWNLRKNEQIEKPNK
ncbi:cortactin-binding protein 2 isoform X3 [Phacochoerus africanus]|uniref:cortactin-binding protein 2 isoform X3 n=1 Tax=Phacochoerus africanus TaxID=41426 RepID=UPI001FD87DF6|nr:cortactin-binding protein 2 isoform X3 [Phacochoerus africanus]